MYKRMCVNTYRYVHADMCISIYIYMHVCIYARCITYINIPAIKLM